MKKCRKCKIEKPICEFSICRVSPDWLDKYCKECKSKLAKEYTKNNKELLAAKRAEYRVANLEQVRAVERKKREKYKERISTRKREYAAKNKEKIRELSKDRYQADRESRLILAREHYAKNKDVYKANANNRKAMVRGADGRYRKEDVERLFELQKGQCANCTCSLIVDRKRFMHIDHIMPLALGGSNWPKNLQLLCSPCNLSKHKKHPLDWAKQNGRLL